jgi:hypothetical protein
MAQAAPDTTSELELTIVRPCLDEAETLEICIQKARASLEAIDRPVA